MGAMGMFRSKPKMTPAEQRKAKRDVQQYRAADRRLQALAARQQRAGIKGENPAYWRANDRVCRLEKKVSKWQRFKSSGGGVL